jgi:cytochrome c biogenesis protein CcmG/thiol:disulfide interchange protein DsbE
VVSPARPITHSHLAALGLLAALGCAEPALPHYVRLEGRAPAVEGIPDGAALVVFWASWCPPCLEELPSLLALAKAPPPGIAVVTFGEDEDEAPVRAHFGGMPPRELGYRPDAGQRVATAYGVDALPAAYFVVDGRLVAYFAGPRDWDAAGMRRLLAKLSRERAPPPSGRVGVDARRDDR